MSLLLDSTKRVLFSSMLSDKDEKVKLLKLIFFPLALFLSDGNNLGTNTDVDGGYCVITVR